MADLKREAARQVEKQHSLAREIGAMTHEDFSHQEETKPSSDRSFGLVVATFFVIVSFWPLIQGKPIRWWSLGLAALFVVLPCCGRLRSLRSTNGGRSSVFFSIASSVPLCWGSCSMSR